MSRLHTLITPVLAAGVLLAGLGTVPEPTPARLVAAPAAGDAGKLVPASGVLFGAAVAPRNGDSRREVFTGLEASAHRPFDLQRLYDSWTDHQPDALTAWTAAQGRIPLLSIKAARGRTAVSWARIASGAEDAQIRAQADGLKGLHSQLFLAFHHEPENDRASGTPAQYAAAYRHYVNVFRSRGATNVVFVWIMMAGSFSGSHSKALAYYPGDAYVDWIAADGYNWYGAKRGKQWRSFADTFIDFKRFGDAHGKPLMIAEFATLEDRHDPGRKAAWLNDATATIRSWPSLKAVSYFHSPIRYPWWVDTSASSTAAFATMGARLRAVPAASAGMLGH